MTTIPGLIKPITAAGWRARWPDLDARVVAHLERWRDSVPVGSEFSINHMLNWFETGRHGLPLEVVEEVVFPPDGSPCAVPGVVGSKEFIPFTVIRTE